MELYNDMIKLYDIKLTEHTNDYDTFESMLINIFGINKCIAEKMIRDIEKYKNTLFLSTSIKEEALIVSSCLKEFNINHEVCIFR